MNLDEKTVTFFKHILWNVITNDIKHNKPTKISEIDSLKQIYPDLSVDNIINLIKENNVCFQFLDHAGDETLIALSYGLTGKNIMKDMIKAH